MLYFDRHANLTPTGRAPLTAHLYRPAPLLDSVGRRGAGGQPPSRRTGRNVTAVSGPTHPRRRPERAAAGAVAALRRPSLHPHRRGRLR